MGVLVSAQTPATKEKDYTIGAMVLSRAVVIIQGEGQPARRDVAWYTFLNRIHKQMTIRTESVCDFNYKLAGHSIV